MDDTTLMGGRDSCAQLTRDVSGFVFGKPANPPQRARQIFAVDVLHREIEEPVRFTDVVHAAHVGVGDLACSAHLVVELREAHRIVAERFRQELERDGLAEAQIIRPIDFPHSPAAEETDDPVTAVEERARSKRPWLIESDEVSQPLDGSFPAAGGVRRMNPPGDNPVAWLAPIVRASDPVGHPHDAQNRAASGMTAWQFAHTMTGL